MEPITHFLTGACIGRAGLNRKTAYATLAAVLAAEAADIDVLWSITGPVQELKHHRGITHTLVAVPLVAAAAVGVVWLVDRWRRWRRERKGRGPDPRAQAVRWQWVYASALISALSHILLDWTNNYGVRPFFPFNARWYAGSFVFIAEPVLWALLLAALAMPALLGLVGGEIGARRKPFRGQGWAIFALAGMVLVWGLRFAEHMQAQAMVDNTQIANAAVKRTALEPYPINPFRWHAILETEGYFQVAEIDTLHDAIDSDARQDVLYKPQATPSTEAARRSPLGQVYLDWGTWAVVRDVGQYPVGGMEPPRLNANRSWTTVEFTDLRFGYSFLGAGRSTGRAPLTGWVYIVDGKEVAGEAMGGREQK